VEKPHSTLKPRTSRTHLRSPESWEFCDLADCEHERRLRSASQPRKRLYVAASCLLVYALTCMWVTGSIESTIILTAMAATVFGMTVALIVWRQKR
jgi:Flp pilus assembly protein TadB